ncbi:hypothetical protein H310_03732 [Aphanomyces invadans]|uniref:Uncharacterized protein n=1 Tax=Aphanomyces invadans TaxID=157072 RepID=A0A024UJU8_9STRA|nr:hypothetical protein H310_03732 [Aphanomyces invadans]ETW06147.1 hypothetical protein H310_03732 [Aphanomyces invadans]|eukprot:XP_008865924.1 hypothetical protein H310_03732 [Aphanomyces invadans]
MTQLSPPRTRLNDRAWESKTGLHRAGTASHVHRPTEFADLSIDLASPNPPSLSRHSTKCTSPHQPQPLQTFQLFPKTSKSFPGGFAVPAALTTPATSSEVPHRHDVTRATTTACSPQATVPTTSLSERASATPQSSWNSPPPVASPGKRTSVVAFKTIDGPLPTHRSKSISHDSRSPTKHLVFGGGYIVEPTEGPPPTGAKSAPMRRTSVVGVAAPPPAGKPADSATSVESAV